MKRRKKQGHGLKVGTAIHQWVRAARKRTADTRLSPKHERAGGKEINHFHLGDWSQLLSGHSVPERDHTNITKQKS